MPLTPEQLKEMQELEELDQLEKVYGQPQSQESKPGIVSRIGTSIDQGLSKVGDYIDHAPAVNSIREFIGQPTGDAFVAARKQYKDTHPQPITGMEDPVYRGLGFASPESGLSALKAIKPGVKKLRDFLRPAAQRSEVLDKVKNVEQLNPYLQGQIDDAMSMYTKREITPRVVEQQARAGDQLVNIDPSQIRGIHPEVDTMLESAVKSREAQPYSAASSQAYGSPEFSQELNLPMKEVLDIRKKLNTITPRFDDPNAKTKILNAGNYVRQRLGKTDPNIPAISEELQSAYSLPESLGLESRDPSRILTPAESAGGLTKRSELAQFDKKSGSNLTQLGEDVKTANERLQPLSLSEMFTLHGPKRIITKAVSGPLGRAYDATAQKVLPTLNRVLDKPYSIDDPGFNTLGRFLTPKSKKE